MAGFVEKKWDMEYVQSFSSKTRTNALRYIVKEASQNKRCLDCLKPHDIKQFQIETLPSPEDLRVLMTPKELRTLFDKRSMFKAIYGNGDLLLNCLFAQCPICGSVVSLGHFNDAIQKHDKMREHINSAHYKDPLRNRHRCKLCLYT